MKKALGYFLISLPLQLLFITLGYMEGLAGIVYGLEALSGVLILMGLFNIGIYLLGGYNK